MANRWGNNENSERLLFSWAPKSLWTVTAAMKLKDACFLEEKLWLNEQCMKKQRHYFAHKGPYSQSYGFPSSHVRMWELDYKEGWALKNWCFQTVVLERTLKSPLDSKEIKPVNPKGKQPWIFIGRTDTEAPIFGHLWEELTLEKTLMLGKIEGRGRRRWQRTRCLYGLSGHEFEQTPGDGEGQAGLACCSPWGCNESDTTVQLKNKNVVYPYNEIVFDNKRRGSNDICYNVNDLKIHHVKEVVMNDHIV